ncbi:MAG: hypothetical protein A3H49_02880 [Nitrospirae bacterium RIFCSPLOWO2_02_FULL_62_14]|nr:MAG: hypothetical protein A3H49_02880 [Nitrospirae bacterium RIFCSPLOWO2_02_FULL_62_14]OGW68348.1 MAG: hypothetical protein A3A88_05010 [Nitrospirae bacterium RIFCSPLOWO2_01_FULL_62_17]
MAVRPDIGDSAHPVDMEHDEIRSPGGSHSGRRVNFKLGAGSRKGLADEGTYPALDQVEHDAADALVGVVDMLGDFDTAMFADGQDAVVIQQRFGAGLLVRFDDILEQHAVLDFCRNGLLKVWMGDSHLPFHGRKDADVLICSSGRVVRPGRGDCQKQDGTSNHEALVTSDHVIMTLFHFLLSLAFRCCRVSCFLSNFATIMQSRMICVFLKGAETDDQIIVGRGPTVKESPPEFPSRLFPSDKFLSFLHRYQILRSLDPSHWNYSSHKDQIAVV